MDWTTAVVLPAVSALVGAAIPGVTSWWGVFTERQKMRDDRIQARQESWSDKDAPVVANVLTLLIDVNPDRRDERQPRPASRADPVEPNPGAPPSGNDTAHHHEGRASVRTDPDLRG